MLNSPLLTPLSVSVRSSISPVRLLVTRTTSVSISVPSIFASVSRIVVGSESPGSIVVGYVDVCVVSPHATIMLPDVVESVAVCVSAYRMVSVSPGITRSVPESESESARFVVVGRVTVLNSPLLVPTSVKVTSSVSPVRLFVTRTTTVSTMRPLALASVSRIVPPKATKGWSVDGNVPEEAVSGQTTLIGADVTESVGVCVSTYTMVRVSPGRTRNVPERDSESDSPVEVARTSVLKTPVFVSDSFRTRSSVSPVLLFVTRTMTVSIREPPVFASVSRIVAPRPWPGAMEVGKVPEQVVSPKMTLMTPEVVESVGVWVSA